MLKLQCFAKPMLYFGVCLSLRALMGVLAVMVAIGFMSIYVFEWRQGSIVETGKGCTVWWNDLRPIHAALYFLAGVSTLKGRPRWLGSLFLSMDVCMGVVYKIIKK
jgi:hypothetical protein